MVNERIIPLNVKPVEEVMVVDEENITPVYERTYIIVYKPAPRTPTPPPRVPTPPRPKTPTPEPELEFHISIEAINKGALGLGTDKTYTCEINDIEEARDFTSGNFSRKDYWGFGIDANLFDLLSQGLKQKMIDRANIMINRCIRHYEKGNKIDTNIWIKDDWAGDMSWGVSEGWHPNNVCDK